MNFNHWDHCDSGCSVVNYFENLLQKEFDSFQEIQSDLRSGGISVFSFVWSNSSNDFSDLNIKWLSSIWPVALFFRDPLPLVAKIPFFKILTTYSDRHKFNSTYFLILKISSDDPVQSAHILHLHYGLSKARCMRRFRFAEIDFNTNRFLSGVVRHAPVGNESSRPQDVILSSALFVHESSAFALRLYFLIALNFLYPYSGGISIIFTKLKVEISCDYLWLEIIPLIIGLVRPSSKTTMDDVQFLCQQTEFPSKINDENYVKNVLRVFIDGEINVDLPIVSSILERFLFPYFSNVDSPTDIFSVDSINHILLSKYICRSLVEYHPRVLKSLLESSHHVQWVLKHLFHMRSLLGDLSIPDQWINRSFKLYQHCLDQLGHFENVVPLKLFGSGGTDRDIDHHVEVFERSAIASMQPDLVPQLKSLALRVARFNIRQSILAMPLPRPSFHVQLASIHKLPMSLKRIISIGDV